MASHMRPVFTQSALSLGDVAHLDLRLIEATIRGRVPDRETVASERQLLLEAAIAPPSSSDTSFAITAVAAVGEEARVEGRFRVVAQFLGSPSPSLLAHPHTLGVIKQMAWPALVRTMQHLALAVLNDHQVFGPSVPPPRPRRSLRGLLSRRRTAKSGAPR
jgi:hypothetical protein